MKMTKRKYLEGFLIVTLILALVRYLFPSLGVNLSDADQVEATPSSRASSQVSVPVSDKDGEGQSKASGAVRPLPLAATGMSRFFNAEGLPVKHSIFSVPGYSATFSDQQDVQYVSACHWGIKPVQSRQEAEQRKAELVYVGSNPYVHIDALHNSIPYLVPRASVLLQDIGRSYFDSLQIKGIPLHKLIVTSVLRTKADVERLRGRNSNATQNSCHLYGTTFDICYNRYKTVEAPGESRREVRNDTLKYVLAEVLRDMRKMGRCHVKYEVKQGCFHITVK